ncbi:hypothetical protein [Chachezhania sediminis]|uniref:hypothetical protein n=1 Tax=Chachezhania sediminis TaxID=2599291 RepID=UPI00131B89F0|nr:hypothetical protein [Chachezhania sediminis]
MSKHDLSRQIKALEARIDAADVGTRLVLEPEFRGALQKMRNSGEPIPARWRELEETLVAERVEATFDNLPI